MKYVGMFLVAFGVIWGIWVILLTCRRGHPAWEVLRKYRYAHRGYHEKPQIPENSMAAFRRALQNYYGVELDVHLMRDGNLEGTEERIPLFSEVLELFEGKTPMVVELKAARGNHNELAEAACKLLDQYQVRQCCYGHLHGPVIRRRIEGERKKTEYSLISGDYLGFVPKKICD